MVACQLFAIQASNRPSVLLKQRRCLASYGMLSADDDVFEEINTSPPARVSIGESSRFHVTSGTEQPKGMDRRRPQFPQFMRPSLSAKMREISSRDARDTRDGDRERYHIPDRERERERFHERERAPVVVAEPRAALASTSGGEEPELLVRQNHDLRRRLDEESQSYKRRLETYKQAQAHQAALVSRLQAKILQYKQRCNDLEGQLEPVGHGSDSPVARGSLGHLPPPPIDDHDLDPDAALRLLDDERKKNERMKQLNSQLKQQLDESIGTNEGLTTDLQKLHADWERLRDELVAKEEEWKEEEHAFHDYYTSEHGRLLGLWRDVVCVKRLFAEMQTCTERDLGRMRDELNTSTRDVDRAFAGFNTCVVLSAQSEEKQQIQREHEDAELRSQLHAMRAEHDSVLAASRQKDDRIQELTKEIRALEERCAEAEQNVSQVVRMQAEAELLQGALRDIAHAVIQDAEAREEGLPPAPPHVHLTPPAAMPPRSPKRGTSRMPTSPAFAESTISAVQAALHKYQLQIHELQVKLQTHKEQCSQLKKQYDSADEAQHGLAARVSELTSQLDASKAQVVHLMQEKELFLKSLDTLRGDKASLEKTRVEMSALFDSLNSDYEKQQKTNSKLQKLVDSLEDEKLFLQSEVDRMGREGELREQSLRAEEDRGSRLREELLTTREDLSKACLERDMLQSQKAESDKLLSHLEKGKGDVELEIERLMLEKGDLQDNLDKTEHKVSVLEHEKRRLHDDVKRLEAERGNLQNQCSDQQNDLISLKKELLQAEQTRMDLESEKISLLERVKFMEIEKDKMEAELSAVTRERNELSNQLTAVERKRETLREENVRIRQRLEQASETNSRINRNLEDLLKENEEKQVILEGYEKDIQRLQEQLASLRSEKEALEAVLFDTQTNLEATEIKRFQLDKENQDLHIKQEALRGQVARLTKDLEAVEKRARDTNAAMMQRMQAQEAEYQLIVANLKKLNDENTRKLTEEREQVRISLEKRMMASMQQITGEKDQEVQQLQERIDTLQQHIENLCQQHEEVLLRAENDKQQALLLAHHDQQALADRLEALMKELEEERNVLDKVKRDAASRNEQDRVTINSLRDELGKLKTKLEELRIHTEEEKARLETKIDETRAERDAALAEAEELRVQINVAEDRNDGLQNQLQDTLRRFKEGEASIEGLRKELTDVRRQLSDSNFEKEKYNSTNKELREHIKRTEQEKREVQRSLDEAFQKISSLEDSKAAVDAERSRLQGQMKEQEKQALQIQQALQHAQDDLGRVRNASSNQASEDKERQARLFSEIEERERAQQELHQLKKQIVELDASLEVARQEMARLRARGDEEDTRWRHREQELMLRLEDIRGRERKLEDQKHNLEVCLADATQQIQELKARLGGTEGRVKALETQLQQLEAAKKMAEHKLTSVASTLRRIAGIQLDGSVSLPYKLMSPSRRWSPARNREGRDTPKTPKSGTAHEHHRSHGHSHCHDSRDAILDVDPEAVRKGVRTLMQQVAQIERERDDLKTALNQMKRQLHEASEIQSKGDNRLEQALQNLRVMQEEKGSLEAKLGQKQAALQAQSEAVATKAQELHELRDKVTSLELSVRSAAEEKSQYEDKIDKLKAAVGRLEGEKRGLQEELSRAESRATKLELHRMALEGDLQRVQMLLQDKDAQIQKSTEKCEAQMRNVSNLEERCASLKATIEQLNVSLERQSGGETDLRNEVAALQRTLQEANANVSAGAEKLKQMQKSLNVSENERRVLAERLDATQQALNEARRAQQALQDQVQRLQNDLSNVEVYRSGLETQLRHASGGGGGGAGGDRWTDGQDEDHLRSLQREKADLRSKVDNLHEKIRQLEADKRSLERTVTKANLTRSKSIERSEKGSALDELSNGKLELENRELRHKIRRLETQLAEKEAELIRLRNHKCSDVMDRSGEMERCRAAQLQAERLLEAREQSHRQQVLRLENQIQLLREQLNQEVKRRQLYVLRSSRAGREVQQMRQALGDSLRTVAQDPQLDSLLLEHETRRLDSTMASSAPLALPPADYSHGK